MKSVFTDTHTVTNTHEFLGDHGEGVIPVPIPNTEVKPFSADGTAWATVWESRTLPRLRLVLAKAGHEKPAGDGRLFFGLMGRCCDRLLAGVYPVRKWKVF